MDCVDQTPAGVSNHSNTTIVQFCRRILLFFSNDADSLTRNTTTGKPTVLPPSQVSHTVHRQGLGFSRVNTVRVRLGLKGKGFPIFDTERWAQR